MKRIHLFLAVSIIAMFLVGCAPEGDVSNVEIDYGESESYTKEELEQAARLIMDEFEEGELYRGCELIKLEYRGVIKGENGEREIEFKGDYVGGEQAKYLEANEAENGWSWNLKKTDTKDGWAIVNYGRAG